MKFEVVIDENKIEEAIRETIMKYANGIMHKVACEMGEQLILKIKPDELRALRKEANEKMYNAIVTETREQVKAYFGESNQQYRMQLHEIKLQKIKKILKGDD